MKKYIKKITSDNSAIASAPVTLVIILIITFLMLLITSYFVGVNTFTALEVNTKKEMSSLNAAFTQSVYDSISDGSYNGFQNVIEKNIDKIGETWRVNVLKNLGVGLKGFTAGEEFSEQVYKDNEAILGLKKSDIVAFAQFPALDIQILEINEQKKLVKYVATFYGLTLRDTMGAYSILGAANSSVDELKIYGSYTFNGDIDVDNEHNPSVTNADNSANGNSPSNPNDFAPPDTKNTTPDKENILQ